MNARQLGTGVLVHVHDVFLPTYYPRQWVLRDLKFWTEQYLLQAFLAFNHDYEVLRASRYMSLKFREKLEEVFPSWKGSYDNLPTKMKSRTVCEYDKNVWPVSFWIRRKLD